MIIQIRGTSGSGKSTIMKKVMDQFKSWEPVLQKGRRQPLYYLAVYRGSPLIILGHYNSACGGCDTIGSAAAVYKLIQNVLSTHCKVEIDDEGEPVLVEPTILCEGLLLSEDSKWTGQLDKEKVRVLYLTTPLETCLAQIKQRRAEAGNEKPLNPANTANRVGVIEKSRLKLTSMGYNCRRCAPRQAEGIILNWIKGSAAREPERV